jgi:hypothetical protein
VRVVKFKELQEIEQAPQDTNRPLGGKKTGHCVAHSFIASVTMVSLWETRDPYKHGSMKFTNL